METSFPSKMFYRICSLETNMKQRQWLQLVATSLRHIMLQEGLLTKPLWRKPTETCLAGGCQLIWGELYTRFHLVSLKNELYILKPSPMNWSFGKLRPEFERIWANRGLVLGETKSNFDPKPQKFSDFEHLLRIQLSQEVRDSDDTETQCWCVSLT